MKYILLILLVLSFGNLKAQSSLGANYINAYTALYLRGYKLDSISNDPNLIGNRSSVLPTQQAVKSYVNSRGFALTSNDLTQFANTTSSGLAGVISDEYGAGRLVFVPQAPRNGMHMVVVAGVPAWVDTLSFSAAGGIGLVGNNVTLGINPLFQDAVISGSNLYKVYFDSMTVTQRASPGTGIYVTGFRTKNTAVATNGNPQWGPAIESEGSVYYPGDGFSESVRGGFWTEGLINGSTPEIRVNIGTILFHPSGLGPTTVQAYVSDRPNGGSIHSGYGIFNGISLSYHEISANFDMGTGGFFYYNVVTANSPTLTLLSVAAGSASELFVENYGSGTVTVKGAGSENITFNGTTANTFTLAQYKWAKLRVNAAGTAWYVIQSN